MPGPVHDYKIAIKVRSGDFLKGTHNVYRVNCIRYVIVFHLLN